MRVKLRYDFARQRPLRIERLLDPRSKVSGCFCIRSLGEINYEGVSTASENKKKEGATIETLG